MLFAFDADDADMPYAICRYDAAIAAIDITYYVAAITPYLIRLLRYGCSRVACRHFFSLALLYVASR